MPTVYDGAGGTVKVRAGASSTDFKISKYWKHWGHVLSFGQVGSLALDGDFMDQWHTHSGGLKQIPVWAAK